MYLDHYKLKEFPFSITCDERFFYESAIHAEALANMMYTVQQRKGMVLVTGEVGAGKTFLGIDICGVGAGIADMFRERDLRPIAIRSHGGNNVTVVESEFRVPKRDMIGRMRMLFQQGRLRISSKLRDVEIFKTELRNFRMKISQSGHDTYEHHRANMHDDLLISAGMACWLGMREEIWRTIYGDEETPPELLEMMRQIDADPLADERELRRRQSPTYDGRPIF